MVNNGEDMGPLLNSLIEIINSIKQRQVIREFVPGWLISVYGTTSPSVVFSVPVQLRLHPECLSAVKNVICVYNTLMRFCLSTKPPQVVICSKVQIVLLSPVFQFAGVMYAAVHLEATEGQLYLQIGIQDRAALYSSVAHLVSSGCSSGFTISSLYTLRMASHTNRY